MASLYPDVCHLCEAKGFQMIGESAYCDDCIPKCVSCHEVLPIMYGMYSCFTCLDATGNFVGCASGNIIDAFRIVKCANESATKNAALAKNAIATAVCETIKNIETTRTNQANAAEDESPVAGKDESPVAGEDDCPLCVAKFVQRITHAAYVSTFANFCHLKRRSDSTIDPTISNWVLETSRTFNAVRDADDAATKVVSTAIAKSDCVVCFDVYTEFCTKCKNAVSTGLYDYDEAKHCIDCIRAYVNDCDERCSPYCEYCCP